MKTKQHKGITNFVILFRKLNNATNKASSMFTFLVFMQALAKISGTWKQKERLVVTCIMRNDSLLRTGYILFQ